MKSANVVGLLINYRDSKRSVECIESLLGQRITQIVVWDNSADDGKSAAEIAARFSDGGRIRIFVSPSNMGFAAGVNAALRFCRRWFPEQWVLLINNDAHLLAGALADLRNALLEKESALLAFPNVRQGNHILGAMYYQFWTGLIFKKAHVGCFLFASGCCLLIAIDRINFELFDEDFFMYGEDCELSWRLRNRVDAIVHVDKVLVDHEGAASSGLGSSFYEERMVACHFLLARKLSGTNQLLRISLYFSRMVMLLFRAAIRSWRYRSFIPWRALWRGWKLAFIEDPMRNSIDHAIAR